MMVGMAGFEPATSASRTLRSSQTEPHPECLNLNQDKQKINT